MHVSFVRSKIRVPATREGFGTVNHTFGADAHLILGVVLEETLDTTAWELF